MYVVVMPANLYGVTFQRLTYAAETGKQSGFDGVVDQWLSVFCAKNQVHIHLCEGLWHNETCLSMNKDYFANVGNTLMDMVVLLLQILVLVAGCIGSWGVSDHGIIGRCPVHSLFHIFVIPHSLSPNSSSHIRYPTFVVSTSHLSLLTSHF